VQLSRIKNKEDFWSGLMFIAFGLVALIISRDYPMGTAMRMGPGYFPTWLGIIMMVFGAIIAAGALRGEVQSIGRWAFRPLLVLGAAIVAFGLVMETLGFISALAILVVGSTLAGREFKLLEVILLTVMLIGISVGIFVYGIELPFRLFWWD